MLACCWFSYVAAHMFIHLLLDQPISCYHLRNEFNFSGVHGAMNRSGSRAK